MLTNVGPRLTGKDLDAAQAALGMKLPAPYRAFLSKTNGGFVDGSPTAFFCVDTTPRNPVPFGTVAGSDCPPETTEIGWVNVDPIAGLDGDDHPHGYLLLAHRGPRKGQIFFWNEARWTPFFLAREEKRKGSLEDCFARAYADFFAKLEPVASSLDALLAMAGGTLVDSRPPITEADLATHEARRKLTYPGDYRRFLLTTNGGRLEGARPVTLEKGVVGRVGLFGKSRTTPLPPGLVAEHARVRARIPKGTLPVASSRGKNVFLLDVRRSAVVEWIDKDRKARPVSKSFDAFVESVVAGKVSATADAKPKRKVTMRDYRAFVSGQLEEMTPALVGDLKNRVFKLKLPEEVTSLDFEVFQEGFDGILPIVGYKMNGRDQVSTDNVAILPDRKPVIPGRLFEPFRGAELDGEDEANTELVMKWFIEGWRKAGGRKLFPLPASIMVHDSDDPVKL